MGGFDYPNQFTYQAEGVFLVFKAIMMLAAFAFSVAAYVLHSLSFYTVANRRGIHHAWLAWIPFGNLWLLGSVSDQYQYVVKGRIKNKRKVLLGLSIAMAAVCLLLFVGMIISPAFENTLAAAAVWVLFVIFVILAFWALTICLAVFAFMAYYDLYRSCDPENSTLFLVLSILFTVTIPFFVFACRKKELGMPPRKPAPVAVIPQVAEPVEAAEEAIEPVEEGFAQPEEFEEE